MIVRERAAAPPGRADRGAWATLAILMVIYIVACLDRNIFYLLVGPVKRYLSISDFQMSFLLGIAFALFFAICAVPLGWAVDRFPRRKILFCGVVVWSLATVGCGLATSYGWLFAARMLLGASEAALAPVAHSLLADKFPKERLATALSLFGVGGIVGTGGSSLIGGLALQHIDPTAVFQLPGLPPLLGWQALFVFIGAPGLLLAFLAFAFSEPSRRHVARGAVLEPRERLWPFLVKRRKVFGCFAGSFAVFVMLTYSGNSWMPTYMARHFHWAPGAYGPVLGLITISAGILGGTGSGLVADRLMAKSYNDAHLRVLMGQICIGAPIGIAAFFLQNPYAFLACLFVFSTIAFTIVGYMSAAVQLVTPPALRGRMAALFLLTSVIVGSGCGPSLTAAFTDFVFRDEAKLGFAYALTIAVCAPVALFFAWLGLKPMREAVEDQRRLNLAPAPAAADAPLGAIAGAAHAG